MNVTSKLKRTITGITSNLTILETNLFTARYMYLTHFVYVCAVLKFMFVFSPLCFTFRLKVSWCAWEFSWKHTCFFMDIWTSMKMNYANWNILKYAAVVSWYVQLDFVTVFKPPFLVYKINFINSAKPDIWKNFKNKLLKKKFAYVFCYII